MGPICHTKRGLYRSSVSQIAGKDERLTLQVEKVDIGSETIHEQCPDVV